MLDPNHEVQQNQRSLAWLDSDHRIAPNTEAAARADLRLVDPAGDAGADARRLAITTQPYGCLTYTFGRSRAIHAFYASPSIVTHAELVIVGLGCVGIVVGGSVALVAGSGNGKPKSAPVLSFAVSVGRVVFAGGLALFIGSFASVLHQPLGREVDLAFALAGKGLGVAAALLGGYAEEHAKYSLAHAS